VCSSGYTGDQCDLASQQVTSDSSSSSLALIAGLSVLGALLLLVGLAIVFYCFVYPRVKAKPDSYKRAPSDLSSDEQNLTKFDQNSVKINKWWPKSPQRYVPQTYSVNDEPTF